MFTTLVMVLVIGWAIRNICRELGVTSAIRKKVEKALDDED